MPLGYLVFLAVVTCFVLAAALPGRQPGRVRYLLSVSVNEVPQVFALGVVTATVGGWLGDDLAGTSGVLLTTVAAGLVAATALLAWRARAADDEVGSGLRDGGLAVLVRPGWRRRGWLLPLPLRPPSVLRHRGLGYGPHRRQGADVYRRRDGVSNSRVLVYLHGGGYYSGGRHRESRALLHRLAAEGWTCLSAGYRLRPGADFEDHLEDARAALRLAHTYAEQADGPPEAVVMAGSSAGAHLSALCALTQCADVPRSRVDAVVGLYGYYGRYYGRGPAEAVVSSPLALDAVDAPPFLLVHGDRDSWVPVEQARDLRDHLRRRSRSPVAYVELAGAQHGFDLFASPRFRAVVDGVVGFLAAVIPERAAVTEPDRGAAHR